MNSWDRPAFISTEPPLRTESAMQKQGHLQYKLQPTTQRNISRRFVVWKLDSYMQGKYFNSGRYGHLCGKSMGVDEIELERNLGAQVWLTTDWWSGQSPCVWCLSLSLSLVSLMISTFLEEWKFKTTNCSRWTKSEAENLNPISCLECQR